MKRLLQFRIRDVMILAAVISVPLGLIANEPTEIGLAALFCAFSSCVLMTLIAISIGDFWSKIVFAYRHWTLRPFIGRIKWLLIDTVILIWTIAIISISNYIIANSIYRASWLVVLGAICGPVVAWRFFEFKKSLGSKSQGA